MFELERECAMCGRETTKPLCRLCRKDARRKFRKFLDSLTEEEVEYLQDITDGTSFEEGLVKNDD